MFHSFFMTMTCLSPWSYRFPTNVCDGVQVKKECVHPMCEDLNTTDCEYTGLCKLIDKKCIPKKCQELNSKLLCDQAYHVLGLGEQCVFDTYCRYVYTECT